MTWTVEYVECLHHYIIFWTASWLVIPCSVWFSHTLSSKPHSYHCPHSCQFPWKPRYSLWQSCKDWTRLTCHWDGVLLVAGAARCAIVGIGTGCSWIRWWPEEGFIWLCTQRGSCDSHTDWPCWTTAGHWWGGGCHAALVVEVLGEMLR